MNCSSSVAADFASSETSALNYTQKQEFRLYKKFALAAATTIICYASLGLPKSAIADDVLTIASIQARLAAAEQPIKAEPSRPQYADDATLVALNSFVQQIAAEEPKLASVKTPDSDRQFDDHAFAALQDFTRRLGTAQPESAKDLPKLAEADNAFDALREFLQKGAAPQSSSPKAGPVAGGSKKSSAPVEATFVGAKVCMTCHSGQAESFGKTLMGRIGKTQKGKFDCENCHGPGSAHVKAGGGRGVGGIISFRPEDQARTSEENNAVCLNCHQRGDRTYWNGSTHETRGLMCTNCHTIMKEVSRKHQLKTAVEPDTCFQCHKDRRAQMARSSHMPLREGKMACSDCHNPHGSRDRRAAAGEFDQRQLLQVPCREARAVPVRTRPGARELPELSRSAWLGERVHAQDFAAAAVHRVPRLRSRHNQRSAGRAVDQPPVPELPYRSPRHQQPVGSAAASLERIWGDESSIR